MDQYNRVKNEAMKEALTIFKQIIVGLQYIYNNCYTVHQDLKPSSVFLNKKLEVKLGDFELAKSLQPFTENTNTLNINSFFGDESNSGKKKCKKESLVYSSPEQIKAAHGIFDQRAVIYSLGLIALRLFHPMATVMETYNVIKELKQKNCILEEKKELSDLIRKMISEKPNERPSLEEIVQALDKVFEDDKEKSTCCQDLGLNLVKFEGSNTFQQKLLKIIERKLYVFGGSNEKKAEKVFNLEECNILIDERKQFQIEHPYQLGCMIMPENEQSKFNLLDVLRKIFAFKQELVNFCYLSRKI